MMYFRHQYPPVHIAQKRAFNAKKCAPEKSVETKSIIKIIFSEKKNVVLASAKENGADLSRDWQFMAGWKLA